MSTPLTMEGRLKGFRLSDVPEKLRQRAADHLIRREDDFVKRLQIGAAARQPSNRLYFVPVQAWERVMLPKNRRKP